MLILLALSSIFFLFKYTTETVCVWQWQGRGEAISQCVAIWNNKFLWLTYNIVLGICIFFSNSHIVENLGHFQLFVVINNSVIMDLFMFLFWYFTFK